MSPKACRSGRRQEPPWFWCMSHLWVHRGVSFWWNQCLRQGVTSFARVCTLILITHWRSEGSVLDRRKETVRKMQVLWAALQSGPRV